MMSGYQLFIGCFVVIMLVPLWVLMSNTTNDAIAIFDSISPSFSEEYAIGGKSMYAYLFIVSIVLLIWVYRSGVIEKNQKENGVYYG